MNGNFVFTAVEIDVELCLYSLYASAVCDADDDGSSTCDRCGGSMSRV